MDTTVQKAFSVLDLVVRAGAPMRLAAVSEALGLNRSNAHRLLSTLVELGYLEREEATGRYQPTLRVWELGGHVIAANPLRAAVTPYAQDLHRATGETVSLGLLDGGEVLLLQKIVSPRPLRFTTREGSRLRALSSVAGLCMLAFEPFDTAEALFAEGRDRPEWDAQRLRQELEQIRTQGYAVGESVATRGVMGVAAPLPTRDGGARASLMVSGPVERMKPHLPAIIEETLHACSRAANAVGRF